jgi:hypothetical protein
MLTFLFLHIYPSYYGNIFTFISPQQATVFRGHSKCEYTWKEHLTWNFWSILWTFTQQLGSSLFPKKFKSIHTPLSTCLPFPSDFTRSQLPLPRSNAFVSSCTASSNRSRYFLFQVAPQLYSRGWAVLVPNPLLLRKSGSDGNQTQTTGSVVRNCDH